MRVTIVTKQVMLEGVHVHYYKVHTWNTIIKLDVPIMVTVSQSSENRPVSGNLVMNMINDLHVRTRGLHTGLKTGRGRG